MRIPSRIDRNLIVSAPPGEGKTTGVINNLDKYLNQFNRVIILEPTTAIIHELERYLGDFRYLADDGTGSNWSQYDVIVTTYERADHILLFNDRLASNSLIVIDEVHFLASRATPIVSILGNCRDKARFILMSATVPDIDILRKYLDAEVLKCERKGNVDVNIYRWSFRILGSIVEKERKPTIIFVPTRRDCEIIACKLNAKPFHSGLSDDNRNKALKDFEEGKIDCLVSTTALAYGINTPTERVIIVMADFFKAVDVIQMIGRAGRFSNHAEAHIFISSEKQYLTVKKALRGEFEKINVDDVESLLLRLIKAGKVSRNIYAVKKEYIGVREVYKPFCKLVSEKLVYPDMRLTKPGHLLAKYYLPVHEFLKVKPLLPRPPNLYALAKALNLDFNCLIRPNGDTLRTVDKLERFSSLLYDLTYKKGWFKLAQNLHLAKLAIETGNLSKVPLILHFSSDERSRGRFSAEKSNYGVRAIRSRCIVQREARGS